MPIYYTVLEHNPRATLLVTIVLHYWYHLITRDIAPHQSERLPLHPLRGPITGVWAIESRNQLKLIFGVLPRMNRQRIQYSRARIVGLPRPATARKPYWTSIVQISFPLHCTWFDMPIKARIPKVSMLSVLPHAYRLCHSPRGTGVTMCV